MNYPNALNELQLTLESFLNIYYVNKNREELILALKDSVGMKKIIDIFNKDLPVKMLDKRDLYYMAKACMSFYKENVESIHFNKSFLDVNKYFDEREIEQIENTLIMKEEKDDEYYLFHDVTKVDDKQYIVGRVTSKQLLDIVYGNFIKYDFKMQRESEKIVRNGVTYETAKIYKKSIRDIKEKMKLGKYRPTAISINVLDKSDDASAIGEDIDVNFIYDAENRTLAISKKDRNSLIDGMHRLYAIMDCYNEDENFEQLMQLNIFFMTQTEARDFIYQEGQKNAISKEQLNKFNSSNIYNLITLDIEKQGDKTNNFLKGLLGNDKKDIELMDKFTTFSKFTEALKDNFTIDYTSLREQRLIKRYIINFYNELLSIYNNETKNIKASRLESNALHCNMIYLYMRIARELYEKDNWEDKLYDILSNIDSNINGKLSKISDIYNLSDKNKNIIYNYFDQIVKIRQ